MRENRTGHNQAPGAKQSNPPPLYGSGARQIEQPQKDLVRCHGLVAKRAGTRSRLPLGEGRGSPNETLMDSIRRIAQSSDKPASEAAYSSCWFPRAPEFDNP